MLACFYYGDTRDAAFLPTICQSIDPEEWEETRKWRRAYLGRYGRQPWSELDNLTTTEIRDYVRLISDMIKAEAGTVTRKNETNWI